MLLPSSGKHLIATVMAALLAVAAFVFRHVAAPDSSRPQSAATAPVARAAPAPSSPTTPSFATAPEDAGPRPDATARLEPPDEEARAAARRTLIETADLREAQQAAWEMANRLSLDNEDARTILRRLEATGLAPEEADLARTLIWALSLRPDQAPVERIASFALHHPDARVRRTALRTLGALDDPWAQATLERMALGDREPSVRREAVLFLSLRLPPGAFAALARKALATEPEPSLQAAWNRALVFHRTSAETAAPPPPPGSAEKGSSL
ncbi:MAG TPA: HEAT repeat domain-containing protein [Kiritimatiellia bacterium]|nr:HEAT repeat domain-containing protein [Kiritimatiellia bacterium]HRZ12727.1 HEAT repeat domain-containing protein [Kiritimatiellia bacterium]HSA18321.1 HEAT repeat domain-containing protein [Kiritimatiellia bacterium]